MCYRASIAAQQTSACKQSTWQRPTGLVLAERFSEPRRLRQSAGDLWLSASGFGSRPPVGGLQLRRCVSGDAAPAAGAGEPSASWRASTATVASSEASEATSSVPLIMTAGAYVLPHPDKADKGGEDWFFIGKSRRAVGVADGVGGWSEVGVDAGAYARQLMRSAESACEESVAAATAAAAAAGPEAAAAQPVVSPQEILEAAYHLTDARGSATACIAAINGNTLNVSNLGDSGLLVLRAGNVVFHTPQQQHGFNFPFQIGSADSMSDSPSSAERFVLTLQPGDLVVLGTDGLWDNCFDEEVASVLKYCSDRAMDVDKMAQVMAHYARHRASDSKFASPFAYTAFQAGYAYMGGKMDDITVVIAKMEPAAPQAAL